MRLFAHMVALTGLLLSTLTASSLAQDYPSQPIRVIVPFGAGGGSDIAVRIMMERLQNETGATVVVENKPGGLGIIGTEYVRRAKPDGYTLLMSGVSGHSLGPYVSKQVNYDPVSDFTHIIRFAVYPFAVVVEAKSDISSIDDLIKQAKAKPNKLTWAFGSGSGQMFGIAFKKSAGLDVRDVPYKTTPAAVTDLIGGQVNYVVVEVATAAEFAASGKVRILAVLRDERSATVPDVPTIVEAGGPSLGGLVGWAGIAGPKGMPTEVTEWLRTHLSKVLSEPDVIEKMKKAGTEVNLTTKADEWVSTQLPVWEKAAKDAGLTRQ